MEPGEVYTGRGKFRNEIFWGEICTPPQTKTGRKLHSHNRMGRQKKHRHHTGLVIQVKASAPFTSWLHQEGSQAVQPQTIEKENHPYPSVPIKYGYKKQNSVHT